MVQANIQFVIDNKEKIKTRGLISVLSTENTLKKAKGTSPDIKSDCNEENVTTEMEEEKPKTTKQPKTRRHGFETIQTICRHLKMAE